MKCYVCLPLMDSGSAWFSCSLIPSTPLPLHTHTHTHYCHLHLQFELWYIIYTLVVVVEPSLSVCFKFTLHSMHLSFNWPLPQLVTILGSWQPWKRMSVIISVCTKGCRCLELAQTGWDITMCGRPRGRPHKYCLELAQTGWDVTSCGRPRRKVPQNCLELAQTGWDVTNCARPEGRSHKYCLELAQTSWDITSCGRPRERPQKYCLELT